MSQVLVVSFFILTLFKNHVCHNDVIHAHLFPPFVPQGIVFQIAIDCGIVWFLPQSHYEQPACCTGSPCRTSYTEHPHQTWTRENFSSTVLVWKSIYNCIFFKQSTCAIVMYPILKGVLTMLSLSLCSGLLLIMDFTSGHK